MILRGFPFLAIVSLVSGGKELSGFPIVVRSMAGQQSAVSRQDCVSRLFASMARLASETPSIEHFVNFVGSLRTYEDNFAGEDGFVASSRRLLGVAYGSVGAGLSQTLTSEGDASLRSLMNLVSGFDSSVADLMPQPDDLSAEIRDLYAVINWQRRAHQTVFFRSGAFSLSDSDGNMGSPFPARPQLSELTVSFPPLSRSVKSDFQKDVAYAESSTLPSEISDADIERGFLGVIAAHVRSSLSLAFLSDATRSGETVVSTGQQTLAASSLGRALSRSLTSILAAATLFPSLPVSSQTSVSTRALVSAVVRQLKNFKSTVFSLSRRGVLSASLAHFWTESIEMARTVLLTEIASKCML